MYRKLFKQFFTIITLEVLFCTVGADTTVAEGTTGAGGKMSDVSKFFSGAVDNLGQFFRNNYRFAADLNKTLVGSSGVAGDVADFIDREVVNKSDLRGAEAETFLKGLPIVGGIINGAEGINQLEDLYNRTGKIPAYPGSNSPGAAGIGSALTGITRKIEDGSHSLHTFYSGDPEQPTWSVGNMFRDMSSGWNTNSFNVRYRKF